VNREVEYLGDRNPSDKCGKETVASQLAIPSRGIYTMLSLLFLYEIILQQNQK